jgi:hypothetical protein
VSLVGSWLAGPAGLAGPGGVAAPAGLAGPAGVAGVVLFVVSGRGGMLWFFFLGWYTLL